VKKRILVLGSGGFIGGHLVKNLVKQGHHVTGCDLKEHPYNIHPSEFRLVDLSNLHAFREVIDLTTTSEFDEIYQLAADMGGAGYIFSGEHDADVMQNSASINLNLLRLLKEFYINHNLKTPKIFYSSSACIYPEEKQTNALNIGLKETDAYPANPDSEYGWEKLFSERLYLAYSKNYGLDVRIARFHNVYGPFGTWVGGREKAPAALCRKIAEISSGGEIEIWGDGKQTRSFLFVDDCITAINSLMASNFTGPVNVGSEQLISINDLADVIGAVANKHFSIRHIPGPLGVRGRCSNNELIERELDWRVKTSLMEGLGITYDWIQNQVRLNQTSSENSDN
jgi:nucleoside-diphosphate-sugar epimerase